MLGGWQRAAINIRWPATNLAAMDQRSTPSFLCSRGAELLSDLRCRSSDSEKSNMTGAEFFIQCISTEIKWDNNANSTNDNGFNLLSFMKDVVRI